MWLFELIGILVLMYYLFSILLWVVLDSDIELFIKNKLGTPISSLRSKVIWITGASGGIGKSLALELAKNGCKLVLSARRLDELNKVKLDCITVSNGLLQTQDILVLKMDMLDINKHQDYFNAVLDYFNHVDIIVNNAGRSQRADWHNISIDVDRSLFELDVFSIINLSRIAIRYFDTNKINGHLVVTSSIAGLVGAPFSGSYTGAKHALHGYFDSLRIEMPQIKVTMFCPGPTLTDFLQECYTENMGETFGQVATPQDKRMTSERCGYLMAIAIANQTELTWVGIFPITLLTYVALYYPNIAKLCMKYVGKRQIQRIREGR